MQDELSNWTVLKKTIKSNAAISLGLHLVLKVPAVRTKFNRVELHDRLPVHVFSNRRILIRFST